MKCKTLKVHDLSYASLSRFFDGEILYETDKTIIHFPCFTQSQIEKELIKQLSYLLKLQTDEIEGNSEPLNHRGKIIDFLMDLPCSDENDFEDIISYIQETLMMEQMRIYGLRRFALDGDKRMGGNYFNPNAEIVVEKIIQ